MDTVPLLKRPRSEAKEPFVSLLSDGIDTFLKELELDLLKSFSHDTASTKAECTGEWLTLLGLSAEPETEIDTLLQHGPLGAVGNPSSATSWCSPEASSAFDSAGTTPQTDASSPKDFRKSTDGADMQTVASLKLLVLDTSKFISTFTTMKEAYLKLCKEFNYLLGRFNENERVKFELIKENNELKKLLVQVISEREMERKKQRQGASAL